MAYDQRVADLERELAEARGRTPWSELHERIAELERDLAALRVRLGAEACRDAGHPLNPSTSPAMPEASKS